ncbi:MAG: SHOCT domain-containing protein [Lachnospiraceae bacterium]|nr:SHOCT domain-containing protein [Lachnospiraceae bacterium]
MQDIVNGWINGEEKNYFLGVIDLIYYVQGPEAKLFVFKDHLTILSDFAYKKRVDQNCNMLDYSMFYKCQAHVSENEVAETTNFFFQYRDRYKISDLEKINGDVEVSLVKYGKAFTKLDYNISLGEYGTLSFAKCDYSFKFFYHQNQLMEEIYNFLMRQTTIVNEKTVVEEVKIQPVQNTYNSPVLKIDSEAEKTFSLADEISKLKGLLDCGILSQEEFNRAKNKLIDKL